MGSTRVPARQLGKPLEEDCFEALVTNLVTGTELSRIKVSKCARVSELKAELHLLHGCPIASQRLIAGTTVLADDELVSQYSGMEPVLSLSLYMLPEEIILYIAELENTEEDEVMEVFMEADFSMRECFECVLCAVSKNGLVLEFASGDLQSDWRIALAAVSQNGNSIRFVCEELSFDLAVVSAALKNDGKALQHVPEKFRQERRTVDIALVSDLAAIQFVDSSLWHEWSFSVFYHYLYARNNKVKAFSCVMRSSLAVVAVVAKLPFTGVLFAVWGLTYFPLADPRSAPCGVALFDVV